MSHDSPLLANTRLCGSNFNSRPSSQPCGFSRLRSSTTLPKMLGAAFPILWGLGIRSWFSNQRISWMEFQYFAVIWMFSSGLRSSTGHFLRGWGQERWPSVWVHAGLPVVCRHCQGSGEASALLLLKRSLCDSFSYLGGGGRFVKFLLFKWTLSSILGTQHFYPFSFPKRKKKENSKGRCMLSVLG